MEKAHLQQVSCLRDIFENFNDTIFGCNQIERSEGSDIEQTQHILDTTNQNLTLQQTVIKQHLLGETPPDKMETTKLMQLDIIYWKTNQYTKKACFQRSSNVHETSSSDYTGEGEEEYEEDENCSDNAEEDNENRMTQEKKEQFRNILRRYLR